MRVVADIPHPSVKITVFSWNGKYLIKLERGSFEQTYKISEFDVTGEGEVKNLLDETFLAQVLSLFDQMRTTFQEARARTEFL